MDPHTDHVWFVLCALEFSVPYQCNASGSLQAEFPSEFSLCHLVSGSYPCNGSIGHKKGWATYIFIVPVENIAGTLYRHTALKPTFKITLT